MTKLDRGVRFRSFDGVELEGTLTAPSDGDFDHLAVLTPGIEVDREEEGFYTGLADRMAEQRVASFRFEWRCHGYDDARPLGELTLAGLYNDIDAAVRTAKECSNRVTPLIMVGASFAGGMVMNLSRRRPDVISSTILLAPILDYVYEYISGPGLGDATALAPDAISSLVSEGWVASWGKRFSQQIVNEFRAVEVTPPETPCWIIHGDADSGVDIAVPRTFAERFWNVRLFEVPGADHGFAEPGDDELKTAETAAHYTRVYEEVSHLIATGGPTGALPEWPRR